MAQTDQPTNVGSNDGLGLVKRLRLIAQWNKPGGRVPIEPLPDKEKTCADAADEIERLRDSRLHLYDQKEGIQLYISDLQNQEKRMEGKQRTIDQELTETEEQIKDF